MRDLSLPKQPEGAIMASQLPGIRGMSVYTYSPRDNLLLLREKLASHAGDPETASPRNEMLDELTHLNGPAGSQARFLRQASQNRAIP
jgi:hypothetical protein